MTPVRIIPVLDLMGGVVVRAVAGRRQEYRPITSRLVESSDPAHVAARLLEASGAAELYVADLDAITTGRPVADEVRQFVATAGVEVLFDGGFRDPLDRYRYDLPIRPVLASETTYPMAAVLHATPEQEARMRPAFSVDLRAGQLVSVRYPDPFDLAFLAVAAGFPTLIVLDVAFVGTGTGPGTEPLVRELRKRHPAVELIAGGGIRDRDDVARLADAGADAVLVASALHDGRLLQPAHAAK